ncbi:hypothetical protein [Streptomyces sp. NPDC093109]|uniref:hypothetical protein n=1 Tax=Streptomyces sp. NPDC093109 TaxID=3154977 RepID=UPI00344C3813
MELDPAVEKALFRAVGHRGPITREERESITGLNIRNAENLSRLDGFSSLKRLVIVGCDPIGSNLFSGLDGLRSLVVEDSGLREISEVGSTSLLNFSIPRNFVEDLAPLLSISSLLQFDVTGNPLSEYSYREVIPEMIHNGCRVQASEELEWKLTLRLHSEGVPISCYESPDGYRLCRPGLELTDSPQYAHPVISLEDIRKLLRGDPLMAHEYFDQGDRIPFGSRSD